jgi:hypothetical protein
MFVFLARLWLILRSRLRSRARLEAENLVLRRQVLILSRKSSRARLRNLDRLILVWLYRIFPTLLSAIAVVKPETVIRWHRRGFRAYWHWKSRRRGGRPRIDRELRHLIRRMSHENPLWGAPRIDGEVLMLGIEVAQSTACRATDRLNSSGMPRSPGGFRRDGLAPRAEELRFVLQSGPHSLIVVQRRTTVPTPANGNIVSIPILGGLHHQYVRD